MLLKKFKIVKGEVFVKVPWNIGCCSGVCDYFELNTCPICSLCATANSIYYPNGTWGYSFWIPKGHLLPKYKKYEN